MRHSWLRLTTLLMLIFSVCLVSSGAGAQKSTSWSETFQERLSWWSLQPVKKVVPLPVKNGWSNHPIDKFVHRRMTQAGLRPGARADNLTLLRRISFALTGLPPTSEQVRQFQTYPNGVGFEAVVDELLGSPRFGEQWARHWMDWVRYAESHGSEGDPSIPFAFRYRDYLIRALNDDVPYDQLVREHIAGDLLEMPRVNRHLGINESALATAHWRMVFHGFAPTDALDEKVRFTDDQINVFGKAFLGLTISCARCHDHKFDAIAQADYYRIFGILGSTRPTIIDVNTTTLQLQHQDELLELKQRIRKTIASIWLDSLDELGKELTSALTGDRRVKRLAAAIAAGEKASPILRPLWRASTRSTTTDSIESIWRELSSEWRTLSREWAIHESRSYHRRWKFSKSPDADPWYRYGNGFMAGHGFNAGEFTLHTAGDSVVSRVLPSGSYSHTLSTKHRGVMMSPRFHLGERFDLWLLVSGDNNAMSRYVVQNYPRNGTVYPVTNLNGGEWRWQRYDLSYWEGDDIHIELTTAADSPVLARDQSRSWFGIREVVVVPRGGDAPDTKLRSGVSVLESVTQRAIPTTVSELVDVYVRALSRVIQAWSNHEMSDEQSDFLDEAIRNKLLRNKAGAMPAVNELVKRYRQLEDGVPLPTRVVGLAEADVFDQPLFERGNHKKPLAPVERSFLSLLTDQAYGRANSGRLELAEDVLRADNPLTARVIVNRLWHHLFGVGIVETPDNFGALGQKPSHPELLDFLARRLMDSQWSLKEMIKFMVLSRTWQMDSTVLPDSLKVDPENRWLSHANIRRLEAESIRDTLLFVSGDIDLTMGGASLKGRSKRRSVYVRTQRNALDSFLRVFDCPEPSSTAGRRDITNVPAQSLALMNSEQVRQQARRWIDRLRVTGELSSRDTQLDHMFSEAFGRRARAEERLAIAEYMKSLKVTYGSLVARREATAKELKELRGTVSALLSPVRARLESAKRVNNTPVTLPRPYAKWTFDGDLRDSIGSLHGEAIGQIRIESGALILDGKSYVKTSPLDRPLRAKSLVASVMLDDLGQRGAGVVTVQSSNGIFFDSIVFAERDPEQWLAGSNNFRRTTPFAGPREQEASKRFVQIVVLYHEDGRIQCYRDGEPYGKGYKSTGPREFKAGDGIISFGIRHLPPGGNRMLKGKIAEAQLFDRVLKLDEIKSLATDNPYFVSRRDVLSALTPEDRMRVAELELRIADREQAILEYNQLPEVIDEQLLWRDVALAIFNMKEFIYIR